MTCFAISSFSWLLLSTPAIAANLNRDLQWSMLSKDNNNNVDNFPVGHIPSDVFRKVKETSRLYRKESYTRLIQEDALFYEMMMTSMSLDIPSYAPLVTKSVSPNTVPISKQPVISSLSPSITRKPQHSTPSATTPSATTPSATTPSATTPTVTTPTVTTPTVTTPSATQRPISGVSIAPATVDSPTNVNIVPSKAPSVVGKTKMPLMSTSKVPSTGITPSSPTVPSPNVPSPNVNPITQPRPTRTSLTPFGPATFDPTSSTMIPSLLSEFPVSSDLPSLFTTESDSPTGPEQQLSDSPTNTNTDIFTGQSVFSCTDNGIFFVPPPFPKNMTTTILDLSVIYSVDTNASLEAYRSDLEYQIIGTALAGALQCSLGGPIFGIPGASDLYELNVTVVTFINGERCIPQVNTSRCQVLETDTRLFITGEDLDTEVATFLALKMLQEQMGDSSFIAGIPEIENIEYLRPLSALPPIIDDDDDTNTVGTENGTISANPWTLGAVVVMCTGGLIALWAWARNRRTRNRRHMQLIEDM